MKNDNEKQYLFELFVKAMEGRLSPEEMDALNRMIQSNEEAAYFYAEFFDTVSGLVDMDKRLFSSDDSDASKYDVWLTYLADEERTAPMVEMPAVRKEPAENAGSDTIRKTPPKVSKLSVISLLLSSAALVFVIGYGFLTSIGRGVEVAVLSDSLHAKWADVASPMEKGTRLTTGQNRWLLREGYAELLFDNQARVTLEGPVEFQILAEDRIGLNYGKMYVRVPQEAAGFSVYTKNAKIIDLGTEFGVEVEIGGNTQLHVLKGKTMLMAGKTDRVNLEISQGTAKKIAGENGAISDIHCRSDYFVRVINSRAGSIWKGQNRIELADIVGGGNGFGTGKNEWGIDPATGQPTDKRPGTRPAANEYRPVPSNPFIDGVFVPNGRTPQVVTSDGHLFRECPETTGSCCESILNAKNILDSYVISDTDKPDSPTSALLLHANMGITFDLQAVRGLVPGGHIAAFQSKFGIRKWALRPNASNADFWVLVDGQVRYVKKQVKTGELHSVNIELSETDRFLTLVQTDGGDPEDRTLDGVVLAPNDSDWGVFVDPILIVQ